MAGQYMIFYIPSPPTRRLYSIASSPTNNDTIDFVIEIVPNGIGSTYIKRLKENDTVKLQGPAGVFTYNPSERTPLFLATGTGIAPIYSIITNLIASQPDKQLQLFWGMKYEKDIYLVDKFEKLAQEHENFTYSICLSRESEVDHANYMKGRVTEALTTNPQLLTTNHDYYLCGGKEMVESLRTLLGEHNVPKEQIYFEKFT